MILQQYNPPPFEGLKIIYVDDYMLAVDKPAGLLSVPGRGEHKADSMLLRVRTEYPDALTVHRLDQDTSGLLLYARGANMHRTLSMAFERRQISKSYLAVIAGRPAADEGEVNLPLICDWPNRPRQKVDFEEGRPSLTRYRVLAYDAERDQTRVQLEPVTGRSHQLRVHMQQLGHPIVGDDLYAPPDVMAASPRLLLHAHTLLLPHPMNGEPLSLCVDPAF